MPLESFSNLNTAIDNICLDNIPLFIYYYQNIEDTFPLFSDTDGTLQSNVD